MPVRPRRDSTVTARNPSTNATNANGTTRSTNGTNATSTTSSASSTSTTSTTSERDARATATVLGGLARRESARTARGQGTVLADGVALRGGRLLVEGQPVVARAALARSGGAALLVAAARIVPDGRPGNGPIAKLSATARRELIAELSPLVEVNPKGQVRASLADVRARSGAFSILEETLLSMRGASEQRAALALANMLVAAAAREPDAGLRVHMQRRLGQLPDRVTTLDKTKALATAVEDMRVRRANEKPLRQEWLKGAPPTLKVLASVQDEFWKSELKEYQKQGYEVSVSGHKAVAKKTFDTGVVVEVQLQERDTDVLDGFAIRDADIILYTGHANLGGVTKIGLENAPRKAGAGKNDRADKLVALFACRSKQNVDMIDRKFPGQHLLVSAEGTYGHDDRIVLHALLEGVARDKTYAQIEAAAKREGLWESKNYFMPNETVALTGQTRVFVPESKTAHGTSISMRPSESAVDPAALPTGAINDATGWMNTIHGYWAEELGTRADKALHDALTPGGWFKGTKNDPVVKLEDVTIKGEQRIKLTVNSAYAHQDPDALAMLVSFHAGMQMVARGDPNRSEHDKRMLALCMVAEYVYFLVEYSDVADTLLQQFAKTHGFPKGLSWPVVEKAISADAKLDCSPKQIAALERGMQHVFLEVNPDRTSTEFRQRIGAALDVLKNSGSKIGLATHEAIVTGKVKIDEMDDLEKADYVRIRRDYLKEGVNLPIDGHKKLTDHSSKAWRAITTDMNGYMWDDRIYVSPGLTAQQLASTLVHEVNHVVNKSEENYRGAKAILAEEYRAFYAEALYAAQSKGRRTLSAAECKDIKEGVIHDYGLKNVVPDDVPDVPKGFV